MLPPPQPRPHADVILWLLIPVVGRARSDRYRRLGQLRAGERQPRSRTHRAGRDLLLHLRHRMPRRAFNTNGSASPYWLRSGGCSATPDLSLFDVTCAMIGWLRYNTLGRGPYLRRFLLVFGGFSASVFWGRGR